jgi:hypothetical protein
MFRASNGAEMVPAFSLPADRPYRSRPRYAACFPGFEISEGGEFTVYKKGPAHPTHTQILPENAISFSRLRV